MELNTTLILFIICFILYVFKRRNDLGYWETRGVPFAKPLPFIGNCLDTVLLGKSVSDTFKKFYFQFDEPFFGLMMFNRPEIVIKCPELIKRVLVKDFSYFQDRSLALEEEMDDFSSNMIFFMKHPKWKTFRAKTTPIFSSKNLKSMCPAMQNVTKSLIDFINTKNNKPIEMMNLFAKYTTQAGFMAVFGVDSKSFQDVDTPLVSIGKNSLMVTFSSIISVLCHHWKYSIAYICKPKMIRSSVAKFLKDVFISILEERKSLNYHRGDFVDLLIKLKDEGNLQDNEIVAQATQFLVAGYESTNVTIALALYELALNKCIQNKLREEVLGNLDTDGDLSYELLNTMDYLDKIVYETLRKYPIFPGIGRTCTKDYKIPDSAVVIEKGVAVIISLSGMHHDPKYFPDPEVFDPERFATDKVRKRHPYVFLPFGEGQRNCIGQRLGLLLVKLGVAYVIKSFEVDICNETVFPLEFDPRKFNLSVNRGVYVQFTKIDYNHDHNNNNDIDNNDDHDEYDAHHNHDDHDDYDDHDDHDDRDDYDDRDDHVGHDPHNDHDVHGDHDNHDAHNDHNGNDHDDHDAHDDLDAHDDHDGHYDHSAHDDQHDHVDHDHHDDHDDPDDYDVHDDHDVHDDRDDYDAYDDHDDRNDRY